LFDNKDFDLSQKIAIFDHYGKEDYDVLGRLRTEIFSTCLVVQSDAGDIQIISCFFKPGGGQAPFPIRYSVEVSDDSVVFDRLVTPSRLPFTGTPVGPPDAAISSEIIDLSAANPGEEPQLRHQQGS